LTSPIQKRSGGSQKKKKVNGQKDCKKGKMAGKKGEKGENSTKRERKKPRDKIRTSYLNHMMS